MSVKVTAFPVCYVLRLKDYPVYAPHTNFALGLYENVIVEFLKEPHDKSNWLTPNLELAKRWASHKKLKSALKQYPEAAKYYYVVGSDQSVVDAETLLP